MWELSGYDYPLSLWRCAEDIARFFNRSGITNEKDAVDILDKGASDETYINFVKNIAFRVYIHTDNDDRDFNWFLSERLIKNPEWRRAVVGMAAAYGVKDDGKL
jgi:hypothetical protein